MTTSKTAATLIVAVLGLAALTPAAFAAGPNGQDGQGGRELHLRQGPGGGAGGGILGLVCAPDGAERLEHRLLTISQRVSPTTEQQPLYDALKTAALTAQTSFADTCATTMPAAPAADATPAERPDMLEMMQTRQKLDEARVAAAGDVLPAFEAFFNSLTDEQRAALDMRGERMGDRDGRRGGDDHRGGPRQGRNG